MSKKILVIDDEQGVCDILKKLFEPEGYAVECALDPYKGVDLAKGMNPDCILLDIKMPQMDGVDVLAKIREFNKNVRVIIITGYGNLETAVESMKLGATDYVTKPFDLDFIKTLVQRSIGDGK